MKYSIFHVQGGIGKHVAATAVAKAIKNNHPDRKLVVVCAWLEVFEGLPYVDRVYQGGNTQYFYDTYIKGQDSEIFFYDPYYTTAHVNKQKSLIENWCELYRLDYNGEKPDVLFNKLQEEQSKNFWKTDKPMMVMHTNGGFMHTQAKPYSWTRDMPFELAQDLVSHYKKDYEIFQVTKINSKKLEGANQIVATPERALRIKELFSMLVYSEKRILIDSCLQHAARALNKPSTVLWVGTSPTVFGYDMHDNITTEIPDINLPKSFLFDFDFNGDEADYPFGSDHKIFDVDQIIASVDAQGE